MVASFYAIGREEGSWAYLPLALFLAYFWSFHRGWGSFFLFLTFLLLLPFLISAYSLLPSGSLLSQSNRIAEAGLMT